MEFDEYRNTDGSYTSPRNGRTYKSLTAFRSHWTFKGQGGWAKVNNQKRNCQHCSKEITGNNLLKHENACYLNPLNIRHCPVCSNPIKKHGSTCSYSCANKLFKVGELNGNWNPDHYRTTCFLYHNKECVVCKEQNIVEVHHLDHNHSNNAVENLIPLCPTHHQYWHSKHKPLIESIVLDYIKKWKEKNI